MNFKKDDKSALGEISQYGLTNQLVVSNMIFV
jgi:hypothetical protein